MFRPYNFKSLLAWTAGSLAGNQAYYDTKIKQARDKAGGENVSPLAAQLSKEYDLYKENGGSLGLEEWVKYRGSSAYTEDFKRTKARENFGEFDPKLGREVVSSLSILTKKVEQIEKSVKNKDLNKEIFEDIFIIFNGASESFPKKYGNTIGHIAIFQNDNLWDKYYALSERFKISAPMAINLRPDLWQAVKKEIEEKFSQNPNFGIKLATWEIAQLSPSAKKY